MKKSIVKSASKIIRDSSRKYIGYCNKCALQRADARKNDSTVFAKALVGGAAIYLTVAAVDFAIDVAPMVVNKIKGTAKKKEEVKDNNSLTIESMKREMAMRKATLADSTSYTDYYASADVMAMNHGEIPCGVIAQAFLDAKPGTLPRITIGTLDSDSRVDEIYTVDGQPKCCPHGEDPATTEHEKDVTFPMLGDERHIEE